MKKIPRITSLIRRIRNGKNEYMIDCGYHYAEDDLFETVDQMNLRLLTKTFHSDKSILVRRAVAWALGAVGGEQAVDVLEEALRHEDGQCVQQAVVAALATIENDRAKDVLLRFARESSNKVLPLLVESLRHRSFNVIVDILVQIGAPAVEPLMRILKHPPTDKEYFLKSSSEKGYEHLCLTVPSEIFIERLVETLVRIGEPAVQPLAAYFRDTSSFDAANALLRLGWQPTPDAVGAMFYAKTEQFEKCAELGEIAVRPLFSFCNKPGAKEALASIGESAGPVLLTMLQESMSSSWHRWESEMIQLLAEIGGSRAAELLLSALGDATGDLKGVVLRFLLKTHDLRGAQVILEYLFQEVYDQLWNTGIAWGGAHVCQCSEDYSVLFGDYTEAIFAVRAYESSRREVDTFNTQWEYSLSEGDQALDMLCNIRIPVSNNILHLVTRKKDLELAASTDRGYIMGTVVVSFQSQRERAKAELKRRGSPSYDPQVFLDPQAWHL